MSDEQGSIPYARFSELTELKNRLQAEVAALKKQNTSLEGRLTKAIEAKDTATSTFEAQLSKLKLDHEMDRVLLSEGIDEQGVEFLRFKYDGMAAPEEGTEKPDFGAWFTGFKETNSSLVSAFVKKEEKKEETHAQPQAQVQVQDSTPRKGPSDTQTQVQDNSRNGVTGTFDPNTLTPQQIAQMTPEQWKAQSDSLITSLPAMMNPQS
jgi:hypothetical protein